MTRIARRRRSNRSNATWATIFWGLAMASLFLLPSNFRAGTETLHGHSLIQLWVDAADGRIDHHHEHHIATHRTVQVAADWFDPRVEALVTEEPAKPGQDQPDVGEHEDSTPAPGGVHLLLAAFTVLPPVAAGRAPCPAEGRLPAGRTPRVLIPPPRS